MKKLTLTLTLFLALAFKTDQPKLLKVEADVATWNKVIEVIDLSAADPQSRVAVKNFIVNQLNQQLKAQDSTKVKK